MPRPSPARWLRRPLQPRRPRSPRKPRPPDRDRSPQYRARGRYRRRILCRAVSGPLRILDRGFFAAQGGDVELLRRSREQPKRRGRIRRDLKRRSGYITLTPEQRAYDEVAVGCVADDDALGFGHVGMGHPDPAERGPPVPEPHIGRLKYLGGLDVTLDQPGRTRAIRRRRVLPARLWLKQAEIPALVACRQAATARTPPKGLRRDPRFRFVLTRFMVYASRLCALRSCHPPACLPGSLPRPPRREKHATGTCADFHKTRVASRDHFQNRAHPVSKPASQPAATWKGGRVVDCTGLENRRCASIRGFESHPFRHLTGDELDGYAHVILMSAFFATSSLSGYSPDWEFPVFP